MQVKGYVIGGCVIASYGKMPCAAMSLPYGAKTQMACVARDIVRQTLNLNYDGVI